VRIFLDNVNTDSSSGPNGFAKKVSSEFSKNHEVYTSVHQLMNSYKKPDVQLSFISTQYNISPIVQRLDGIYFNSEQDFNRLNSPIEETYNMASSVIFQSEFNKRLTQNFFSVRDRCHVIHNGTCLDIIENIESMKNENIDRFNKIWSCASSWRPHKRLDENIRYFLENSSSDDCLIIAGENPDHLVKNDRIFYCGNISWIELISLFKRSDNFIHLAWLDHCPNVVVDARASGCHIVCSSAGGTKEIAGSNSTIIVEEEWDLSPVELYRPPRMDFSKRERGSHNSEIDIQKVSEEYIRVLESVIE